jgi:uncharacterized protein with PhoU and TrkA domain
VLGTIAMSDILGSYRQALEARLREASEIGGATGVLDVHVGANAEVVGRPLRQAGLPRGVLITAIERGREVIGPTGNTIIRPGDRLMALGSADDLDTLRQAVGAERTDESVHTEDTVKTHDGYVTR